MVGGLLHTHGINTGLTQDYQQLILQEGGGDHAISTVVLVHLRNFRSGNQSQGWEILPLNKSLHT